MIQILFILLLLFMLHKPVRQFIPLLLVLLLLASCAKKEYAQRIEADIALQSYNQAFYQRSKSLYFKVAKKNSTLKAQKGDLIDLTCYTSLQEQCKIIYRFLMKEKTNAVELYQTDIESDYFSVLPLTAYIKLDAQVAWEKAVFVDKVDSLFNILVTIPAKDSLHQALKHSKDIDYTRSYSESSLLNELNELKGDLMLMIEKATDQINRMELSEMISLSTTSVLIAERKVIRFLNEHNIKADQRFYAEGLETYISTDKTIYQPGTEISLEVFPTHINASNLLCMQYSISGPKMEVSNTIRGKLDNKIDTIWIPTGIIGDYSITGNGFNFLWPNRIHQFKYDYKVIEE